jgi:hypothetical protein
MERLNKFVIGSQNYRLLERFYDGPITNADMVRRLKIFRYSSRIHDLRRHGYQIIRHAVPDRPGLHVYQLVK